MLISVKVAKLNTVVDFDTEKLPEASVTYAVTYGLTQALNDVHASVKRKEFETDAEFIEAVQKKVDKRLEQIESGNVPGSRAPADPKLATVRKLTKEMSIEEIEAAMAYIEKQRAKAAKAA